MSLFRDLYTNNKRTWETPDPISGDLDIDILIKKLEEKLPIINRKIIQNYAILNKMKDKPVNEEGIFNIISEENLNKEASKKIIDIQGGDYTDKLVLYKVKEFLDSIDIIKENKFNVEKIETFKKPLKYSLNNNKIILSEFDY
jgi:hypothetical protein